MLRSSIAHLFEDVKHIKFVKVVKMDNPELRPDWINAQQATEILGITRNTLKRLVRDGILPAYTIQGVAGYRFKRPEVQALIKPVLPARQRTRKTKSKPRPSRNRTARE